MANLLTVCTFHIDCERTVIVCNSFVDKQTVLLKATTVLLFFLSGLVFADETKSNQVTNGFFNRSNRTSHLNVHIVLVL